MKRFYIISIFPESVVSYLGSSQMARAIKKKIISVKPINPRDFTRDKHRKVDDIPYGGGPGMVMKVGPILSAVERLQKKEKSVVVLLSPRGKAFTARDAAVFAKQKEDIIFISGRYEGIDARVKKILKPKVYSIGSYVLSGGELPALVMIEAISRYIPGFLGKMNSLEERRIAGGETYTRPAIFSWKKKTYNVPKVLLSGHHKKIDEFRKRRKG